MCLSGNRRLAEEELGAGEVDEGQVALDLRLPPHQQPARPVQPAACALHRPAPRLPLGMLLALGRRFLAGLGGVTLGALFCLLVLLPIVRGLVDGG